MTEIMEIQAENPTFHVLFIPGNPGFIIMLNTRLQCMHIYTSVIHTLACNFSGVVSFYKEFLESLYEFLDGNASVIGMAALVFEFYFFESLWWKLFLSEFEFVLLIINGGLVCFVWLAIGQISHTSKVLKLWFGSYRVYILMVAVILFICILICVLSLIAQFVLSWYLIIYILLFPFQDWESGRLFSFQEQIDHKVIIIVEKEIIFLHCSWIWKASSTCVVYPLKLRS